MKQRIKLCIIGAAALLVMGNMGRAKTLEVDGGDPDITAFGLSVNYVLATGAGAGTDANPNHLSITGNGLAMPVTFSPTDSGVIMDGSYDLEAYVDDSGNLSTSLASTLNIGGLALIDGIAGPIGFIGGFTSTLTDIGTNPGDTHIEFTMDPVSYDVLSGTGIPGPFTGGNIDISADGFTGWDAAFGDGGSGASMADTFRIVPMPAALPGGLVILAGMYGLRKKFAR